MAVLTREGALAARRTKTTLIEVPELGGEVLVRRLNAGQVTAMIGQFSGTDQDPSKNLQMACAMVAAAVVDEDGAPVFASAEEVQEYEVGLVVSLATAVADAAGLSSTSTEGK
jgi:hypothetical protein